MLKKNISILGGGLVGSLLSIYLAKKGHQINVFERRPDLRLANVDVGRSINMALSDRGWKALEEIGLAEELKKLAIPMHGRMIHQENGKINFQPYGTEGQSIYSVSRGKFNEYLLDCTEQYENITLNFSQKCWDVDLNNGVTHFEDTITGKRLNNKADLVIGADGAFSSVRNSMQKTERYNYAQFYLDHGYKELTIPAAENGECRLEKNALHIWPRGQFMLIALPNPDNSFTCTLFLPYKGEASFEALKTPEDVQAFFGKTFPDTLALMPNLTKQFFKNPTSTLVTISCFPWVHEDKIALIGDAAHTITPFYGQGMNAGFEDVRILSQIIDDHGDDWTTILEEYQRSRKPNTDAIAELALQNFIEMRDLVADERFLLRKKIEAHLHQLYPDKWIPLYTRVTFSSDLSYYAALEAGKKQDEVMRRIMEIEGIENNWQEMNFEEFITTIQ